MFKELREELKVALGCQRGLIAHKKVVHDGLLKEAFFR
jgi:hypothetical protein